MFDDCTSGLDLFQNRYVQLACLKFSKAFDRLQPTAIDISVGAPRGTKLGPLLWLFYGNDFKVVKYADGTTFHKSSGKVVGPVVAEILYIQQ